jgi:hypothetical protein
MDPSRQEMNPYQFGGANPVMFVDPSGLAIADPDGPPPHKGDAALAYQIIRYLKATYEITIAVDFGWLWTPEAPPAGGVTMDPIFIPYGPGASPCGPWDPHSSVKPTFISQESISAIFRMVAKKWPFEVTFTAWTAF